MKRKEKVRSTDLTKKELPHTRRGVFWDLLKYQKRQMASLSLLLFVFCLPLVVDIILFNQVILGVSISDVSAEIKSSTVFSLIFYMMIISIPCMLVAFIGLGGLLHVLKNMVWQEGIITGPDFFKGIKLNYKQSLIWGTIFGFSLAFLVVGVLFLLRTQGASSAPYINSIGVGLCIVQFIVVSIVSIHGMNYAVYYSNKFKDVFRNAFIFFIAKFFKNILLFILTIGWMVGVMFISFIAQIVIFVLFAFLAGFIFLPWTLLSHEAFDQYINQQYYPEYYKKGLYIFEQPKED